MITTTVPGLATQTIDLCYEAKHEICKKWDKIFGLTPLDIFSAVKILDECYDLRRPWFVFADKACSSLLPK